jgi:hypothetical protein
MEEITVEMVALTHPVMELETTTITTGEVVMEEMDQHSMNEMILQMKF